MSQQYVDEQEKDLEKLDDHDQEARVREHQVKRPWLREDADKPPVQESGDEKPPLKKGNITSSLLVPLPC